jgi:GxxExxY protein
MPQEDSEEERIGHTILSAAMKVHSILGPGLLESAYEICLARELGKSGWRVERQVMLPVAYDGELLDAGYRIDIWISRLVIVEVKAVERLMAVHSAQLLSYLRLSHCKLGFLLNFNTAHMRDGIKRLVNGL